MLTHVFEKVERMVVFRFNAFGHEIEISNAVFVMWIVMAMLIVFSIIITRRMSMDKPGKLQLVAEMLVDLVNKLCMEPIGHHWKAFVPYVGTLLVYLSLSNIITIFNFIPGLHLYPPSKNINVTGTLAVMTILYTLYASFRYKGFVGWIKSHAHPVPAMIPFKILEYGIKPLSLCLRLFGNVVAAFIVMELLLSVLPPIAAPFSIYFDLFDGILQAYIFVYLTALYLGEAVE